SAPAAAGAACTRVVIAQASNANGARIQVLFAIPSIVVKGAMRRKRGSRPGPRPKDGPTLLSAHFHFYELEAAVTAVDDLMAIAGIEICPLARLVELERHPTDAEPFAGGVLKNHDRCLVLMRR